MKHPDDSNFELIAKFENNPPTLSFIQSDYLTTNFQKTFMDFQVVDCKKKKYCDLQTRDEISKKRQITIIPT